jgi:PHD/YefM family antitoxin component YafN of YafNO toxin-antitoxin module
MTRVTAGAARRAFKRVQRTRERVIVHEGGREVAAIVPLEDLALLEELEDRLDTEEALRIERDARAAGEEPISLAEAKKLLGLG